MGGFAMPYRGSRHTTLDVDVTVNASIMALWVILERQPRYVKPFLEGLLFRNDEALIWGIHNSLVIRNRKLLDGVMKIFTRTGPTHDNPGCTEDRLIEVDLVRSGAYNQKKLMRISDWHNV
jgi:hypothetical protein